MATKTAKVAVLVERKRIRQILKSAVDIILKNWDGLDSITIRISKLKPNTGWLEDLKHLAPGLATRMKQVPYSAVRRFAVRPIRGIGATRLARLYGLERQEWFAWDDDRPSTYRGLRTGDYIHLWPASQEEYHAMASLIRAERIAYAELSAATMKAVKRGKA